jgi:hypothetical protein
MPFNNSRRFVGLFKLNNFLFPYRNIFIAFQAIPLRVQRKAVGLSETSPPAYLSIALTIQNFGREIQPFLAKPL